MFQAGRTGILFLVTLAAVFTLFTFIIYGVMRKNNVQSVDLIFTDLAVLAAGILAADLLMTDYSGFGVLTIAVMYGLRKNHFRSMLGGCITLTIMSFSEAPAFLDLLLIRNYNGKRGLDLKYLFYLFYPVHLLILYLIYYFINL
jgi:hypothetical protein